MMNEISFIQEKIDRCYFETGKSYMPLLLFCLFYKRYLIFSVDNNFNKENLLFSVSSKDIEWETSAIPFEWKYSDYIHVCIDIPSDAKNDWIKVIEPIQNHFIKGLLTHANDFNLFIPFINSNQENSSVYFQLLNFICDIINEFSKKHDIISKEFNNIFLYFLKKSHEGQVEALKIEDKISLESNLVLLEIQKDLLNIDTENQQIYTPLSGPALPALLDNGKCSFVGNTNNKLFYSLGKLLQLCSPQTNLNKWYPFTIENTIETKYDNILLNIAIDGFNTRDKLYSSIEIREFKRCLKKLSDKGHMVCTIFMPDENKLELDSAIIPLINNGYLKSVVNFDNKLVILDIYKNTDLQYLNTTLLLKTKCHPGVNFFVHDWYKYKSYNTPIFSSKNMSIDDLKSENYYLTPAHDFRRREYYLRNKDFKFLRLGSVLTLLKSSLVISDTCLNLSLNKYLNGEIHMPHYPYHPYLTSKNGIESSIERNNCLIAEKALIVPHHRYLNCKNEQIVPFLFDPSEGAAWFSGSAFSIRTDIIDPEYLILEMNDESFNVQVHDSGLLKYINSNSSEFISLFLNLLIRIPNTATCLERQRQMVSLARTEHLIRIGENIGFKWSKFSNNENSFLPEGTILKNGTYTYVIKRSLGQGGFGRTYEARRINKIGREGAYVAIKEFFLNEYQLRNKITNEVIPKPDQNFTNLKEALRKFHKEAEIIKSLEDCKYIIKVSDVFDENGTTYYVMEYMKHGDLRNFCQQYKKIGGIKINEAINIITEVALALRAMHKKHLYHLDVKPSNILISLEGHIKLIDFGSVQKQYSYTVPSTKHKVVASPGFTAPELYQLGKPSPKADIYSLGKTLEYILFGDDYLQEKSGFVTDIPVSHIPPLLTELIKKCTAYNPDDRPKDIDDFLSILHECN